MLIKGCAKPYNNFINNNDLINVPEDLQLTL